MRASMSQQPRRISSKLAGSIDHSSFGRPDDRVEADVRVELALVVPGLAAVVGLDDAGRPVLQRDGMRPSNRSGGSMRWSSTETIR